MESFIEIIKLLMNSILRPIKTIKGASVLTYSPKLFFLLFISLSFLLSLISILIQNLKIGLLSTLLAAGVVSLLLYAGQKAIAFVYYVLIKLICKQPRVSFNSVEKLIAPIYLCSIFGNFISIILNVFIPGSIKLAQIIVYIWFSALIAIIAKYKLNQNNKKCMLLFSFAIIINTFLVII